MALSSGERELFSEMRGDIKEMLVRQIRLEETVKQIQTEQTEHKTRNKAVLGGIASVVSAIVSFVVGKAG